MKPVILAAVPDRADQLVTPQMRAEDALRVAVPSAGEPGPRASTALDDQDIYLPAEGILFNADMWSPQQGPLVGYFLVGATELRGEAARLELRRRSRLQRIW